MKNIKNLKNFYLKLHKLEKMDNEWWFHVGSESSPGIYIDDGSPKINGTLVAKERRQLKVIREMLGIHKRGYFSESQRDAVRLVVTYYKKFGLRNSEISQLLDLSESTLRHDYPALKDKEKLHPQIILKLRDQYGKEIHE